MWDNANLLHLIWFWAADRTAVAREEEYLVITWYITNHCEMPRSQLCNLTPENIEKRVWANRGSIPIFTIFSRAHLSHIIICMLQVVIDQVHDSFSTRTGTFHGDYYCVFFRQCTSELNKYWKTVKAPRLDEAKKAEIDVQTYLILETTTSRQRKEVQNKTLSNLEFVLFYI